MKEWADKLACCSFLKAGRRYKSLGAEAKDYVTHSTASSMSMCSCLLSLPVKSYEGDTEVGALVTANNLWAYEPKSFITSYKQICLPD